MSADVSALPRAARKFGMFCVSNTTQARLERAVIKNVLSFLLTNVCASSEKQKLGNEFA